MKEHRFTNAKLELSQRLKACTSPYTTSVEVMQLFVYSVLLLLYSTPALCCSVTSTTTAPAYPSDSGFDTSELIGIAEATEVVQLRVTPNSPPDGWNSRTSCPFDEDADELLPWEDASTWGSAVPADGEDVTLPENSRVLISGCSVSADTVYGLITIPASSELVFADEDIMLNTTGISVDGKLVLGSETCRLHSDISITLHGSRPSSFPVSPHYKGITAQGNGVLDVHGSIFHPTWSRLAATASASDTQIYLQHKVNWQAGQQIVVVATELKDSRDWHHNEVRTISNVEISGEFSRITVTEALNYTHYGGSEYQAEVGLLSHNIIIQGDITSEGTDADDDICYNSEYGSYPCIDKHLTGYGGHTLGNGTNATVRFEGVELYRMGQTNVLARYPFHFHHMGEGGVDSYLKHSSMHHTFYRCATIHGTNHSLISDNVAYDAIGHCFYSGEDGVEENNTLAYNLAAHVHFLGYPQRSSSQYMNTVIQNSTLTQPADLTASPFYITRAYNRFYGNAASGGYSGFAIVKMPEPIMDYRDWVFPTGAQPHNRPFLEFDGNTCHSSGFWWSRAGCIYIGGRLEHVNASSSLLMYNPGRESDARDTMCDPGDDSYECPLILNNTKVFLSNWGVNNWGERGIMDGLEAHDVMRPVAVLGTHYLHNLLFVCRSESFQPVRSGSDYYSKRWFSSSYVGYELYDVNQYHIVDGIIMRNCGDVERDSPVWRFLTHSDKYVPGFIQIVRNVTYDNVNTSALFGQTVSSHLTVSGADANMFDADGTINGEYNGAIGPRIIGSGRENITWWRLDDNCVFTNDYYACDAVSSVTGKSRSVASFIVKFDPDLVDGFENGDICTNGGDEPCPRVGSVMYIGQEGNPAEVGLPIKGDAVISGATNGLGWLLLFDSGSPVSATFRKPQMKVDDTVIIVMPYPADTVFNISYRSASGVSWCDTTDYPFTAASNLTEVVNGNGDLYYFDTDRGLLFFRYVLQRQCNPDLTREKTYSYLSLSYFEMAGLLIPPIQWYGTVELTATCSELNETNSNYCARSSYNLDGICSDYGFESDSSIVAFDACQSERSLVEDEKSSTSSTNVLYIAIPIAAAGALVLIAGVTVAAIIHRKRAQRLPAADRRVVVMPEL